MYIITSHQEMLSTIKKNKALGRNDIMQLLSLKHLLLAYGTLPEMAM